MPSPHDPRALSWVIDWTKQALAESIRRQDIRLGAIDFEAEGSYISKISVAYTNLRIWPHGLKTEFADFNS